MTDLYELVGGTWDTTRAAAATKRDLFLLDDDSHVYRVDPRTGEYLESLGDGYDANAGDQLVVLDGCPYVFRGPATALGDRLFTVDDRTLYAIDPVFDTCEPLANTWDTQHLIGLRDHLFAWDADHALYRIDPATGDATVLDGNWPRVRGVATAVGRLFVVDDGILYDVDPVTGAYTAIADRMHTRLLVGCGSSLLSFEQHGDPIRIGVG